MQAQVRNDISRLNQITFFNTFVDRLNLWASADAVARTNTSRCLTISTLLTTIVLGFSTSSIAYAEPSSDSDASSAILPLELPKDADVENLTTRLTNLLASFPSSPLPNISLSD